MNYNFARPSNPPSNPANLISGFCAKALPIVLENCLNAGEAACAFKLASSLYLRFNVISQLQ